jgi:hypothetical protein
MSFADLESTCTVTSRLQQQQQQHCSGNSSAVEAAAAKLTFPTLAHAAQYTREYILKWRLLRVYPPAGPQVLSLACSSKPQSVRSGTAVATAIGAS